MHENRTAGTHENRTAGTHENRTAGTHEKSVNMPASREPEWIRYPMPAEWAELPLRCRKPQTG